MGKTRGEEKKAQGRRKGSQKEVDEKKQPDTSAILWFAIRAADTMLKP